MLGHFHDSLDAVDGHMHFVGDFFWGGFVAEFLEELFLDLHDFVEGFDHVDGDTDGAGLIGDGAGDGLADPPGGVGREFVAAAVFEFFDGFHEAHVTFLDEVEEGEAAVGVFFGDADDEAEVSFDHFGFSGMGVAHGFAGGADDADEFLWVDSVEVCEFFEFGFEVFDVDGFGAFGDTFFCEMDLVEVFFDFLDVG